ncbi:MAG: DNA gyrase subunit A [Patescibacteria group bacterium]
MSLTDGRNLSFRELVNEFKSGKKNYTYSFNHETDSIEVTEIKNPRLTHKDAELVEVVLDNGERIKCTPDHRFMLRDGSYREAQFLEAKNSLMPAYFRLSTLKDDKNSVGYRMIWQPLKGLWDWVHRLSDKWNIDNDVYTVKTGKVRHHLDFNKLNNSPDNIKRMQWGEHWRLHYRLSAQRHKNDKEYVAKLKAGRDKFWAQPEARQRNALLLSERSKKWWQDPKYREQRIKAVKKLWNNPGFKEKMQLASAENLRRLWGTTGFRESLSVLKSREMKARWQNSEYRQKAREWTRKMSNNLWSDPGHRQRMSRLMKLVMSSEKNRRKISERSKALWQNENFRNKYSPDHFRKIGCLAWQKEGFRETQTLKAKKQWQDPEFRKRLISSVRAGNKRFLDKHPGFMKAMAQKAAAALHKKWQEPEYKERVIKSKILGFVNGLTSSGKPLTREAYQQARTNNGIPGFTKALEYFGDADKLAAQAKVYNHKVVAVQFLTKKEDVYDLTVDKNHNFALAAGVFVHNSVDGDSAAAYRYTEAKLAPIAEMLLSDIEKNTVNFMDNYDATHQEPTVLPTRIPNLLLNGSMGIAVGMATNIPPHNLGEVLDGLVHVIDNPNADIASIGQFIKGPDFPTGGTIYNEKEIQNTYATGRGPIIMRAKAEIVESERRGFQIIVSEIPYQVNKAELIIKVAELVKDKKVDGIKDIRDESDKDGLRIAVDLKPDAFPRKVLNQLFKYTELQKSFHVNMLGLVDGIQPQILNIKTLLEKFIEHRQTVVTRRTKYDLGKAKDRAHILEGLKQALDHIDEIIKLIKKSDSKEDAFRNLIKQFKFSDRQATAILEMRLQALAGLERQKIEDELKEKKELIAYLENLLAHPKKVLGVIKEEFKEIKEKFADERRTKIVRSALKEIGEEELIPEADSLFMLTQGGYLKRIPPEALKSQKRGGKGLIGIATKEEDVVQHFFVANTHDNLMFFTNSGKVFQTKGYEVPESTRQAKGKAIVNFLQVTPADKITAVVPIGKNEGAKYLVMVTANGIVKKVETDAFGQVRKNGMVAIKLKSDDELKWVMTSSGSDEIILTTSNGLAIRFKEKDVRPMGRAAAGVIGVRLSAKGGKGAKIVGADVVPAGKEARGLKLLAVMANGYGKRTALSAYKIQKRGGKGIMTAKITAKTGQLVSAHITGEEDKEVIAVSKKGVVIRTELNSISELGRATQGVRVMKLESGDAVASVVLV